MVWKELDQDKKPRYIKKTGNFFYLSREKSGALDSVPDGWKVIRKKNGRLALIRD